MKMLNKILIFEILYFVSHVIVKFLIYTTKNNSVHANLRIIDYIKVIHIILHLVRIFAQLLHPICVVCR